MDVVTPDNKDLLTLAREARPIDGQQVFNIVESAQKKQYKAIDARLTEIENTLKKILTALKK